MRRSTVRRRKKKTSESPASPTVRIVEPIRDRTGSTNARLDLGERDHRLAQEVAALRGRVDTLERRLPG